MPVLEPLLEEIRVRLEIDPHIWLVGEEHIDERSSPPRYVWVPMDEDEEEPEGDEGEAPSVVTRLSTVVLHLWGEDLGDTEDRYHDLRRDLAEAYGKSVVIGSGKWASGGGAVSLCGRVLHIPITFKIPVRANARYTYSKGPHEQGLDTTGSASGDNVLQLPE
jgi:hypothetical protein